jgi:hypothetical protein
LMVFFFFFFVYIPLRAMGNGGRVGGVSGHFMSRRILVSKFNTKQKKSLLGINDVLSGELAVSH